MMGRKAAALLEMMMVVIDTPPSFFSPPGIHTSSRILLLALALFHNVYYGPNKNTRLWARAEQQLSGMAKHSISLPTYFYLPPHSLRMDGVARYHEEFDPFFFSFAGKGVLFSFSRLWIGHTLGHERIPSSPYSYMMRV
jgi:hypothetical protein